MITPEEVARLKNHLLAVLAEDVHNADRLLARLDSISRETGIGAHAALLLILTRLAFDDEQARRHWEAILAHHGKLSSTLGRDVGIRVALLDYFMNVNRRLVQPVLIDLELLEAAERGGSEDVLSGLASDRAFRTALQSELRRSKRYGQKVAVVLFDLDDFAGRNETFGRLVGDRLLRETAILLHNKVRDIDVAARPGEDEFALLLPETDRNAAMLVAERFRWEVESHFAGREVAGTPVALTVSAGVASYPEDAASSELLLERAAAALYRAKAQGRNSVQAYHPERRRYLRFDLEPDRLEIEVLSPRDLSRARSRNVCRNGIVFSSPEPIDVGEEIELRLNDATAGAGSPPLRLRGRVVRLEELPDGGESDGPADEAGDRFEIGVAFDMAWGDGEGDLLEFLEKVQAAKGPGRD